MQDFDLDWHEADFNENGYTILKNAVDPDFVDRLVDGIVRLEGEQGLGANRPVAGGAGTPRGLFEQGSSRVRNLIMYDDICRQAVVYPVMLALLERVLGKGFLMSTGAVSFTLNAHNDKVNPSTKPQIIHTDDSFFPLTRPHAPMSCQVLWALSDFTEENGATRVVPGSHKFPEAPKYKGYTTGPESLEPQPVIETVPALMPKGSIYIHHTSIWHGAGVNLTDQRRYCLGLTYCQGWVRPFENMQMYIPRDMLRTFDPKLQELIGIRGRYAGVVGGIDHRDPYEMIFEG